MKKRIPSILASTTLAAGVLLVGGTAGAHEFEGNYEAVPSPTYEAKLRKWEESDNEVEASIGRDLRAAVEETDVTFGPDYVTFDDQRFDAERIFVREKEGNRYLIVQYEDGSKSVFPILEAKLKERLSLDSEKKALIGSEKRIFIWESEL